MEDNRNLLFGVLAVQLKFLSSQDLMQAAAQWAMRREGTLQEYLVREGKISEKVSEMILSLLTEKVEEHGGDINATLATFGGRRAVTESFAASSVLVAGDSLESFGGRSSVPTRGRSTNGSTSGESDELENVDALTIEHPGRYEVSCVHSRGGIGRVLLATDSHIGREIAIKELLPDPALGTPSLESGSNKTQAAMHRFLREARITGQLEHPAIVPVYEVGKRSDGTIYYTMKFVRGRTLEQAIRESEDLHQRLKLLKHFLDLCHAISYAHSRQVIHRDIKPQNVMVGEFGETVVLDWGLAKVQGKKDRQGEKMARDLTLIREAGGLETIKGAPIGTATYMSPEQAEGRLDLVDHRSDIWSLGVVLYEIIAGTTPYKGVNAYDIMGQIIANDPSPLREAEGEVPPELEAIVNKCLQKDPKKRYQSSEELADDIESFMTGGLVSVYRYTAMALFKRWMSKWWPVAVTAALGVVALIVVFGWSYRNISREKAQVEDQKERALVNIGQAYYAHGQRAAAERKWNSARVFYSRALESADAIRTRYAVYYSDVMPEISARLKYILPGHDGQVLDLAVSGDGRLLASSGRDGKVMVWDFTSGRRLHEFDVHKDEVMAVAFSPQAPLLVSADKRGQVCFLSVIDGKSKGCDPGTGMPTDVILFSPDGKLVATAGSANAVIVFDAFTQSRKFELDGHKNKIWGLSFSPSGDRLVTCSRDWTAGLWSMDDGRLLDRLEGHANSVGAAVWIDDQTVLTGSYDYGIRLWDLREEPGKKQVYARQLMPSPLDIFLSPDKKTALVGFENGTVQTLDPLTGDSILRWPNAHDGLLFDIVTLGEFGRFATCGADGALKLWSSHMDVPANVIQSTQGMTFRKLAFARLPGGASYLVTAGQENVIRVWELDGEGRVMRVRALEGGIKDMLAAPGGRYAAIAGVGGADGIRLIRVADGKELTRLSGHQGAVNAIAVNNDGTVLVSGGADGNVGIWRVPVHTTEVLAPERLAAGHQAPAHAVAVSPDGKIAASAGGDNQVIVWDAIKGVILDKWMMDTDVVRECLDISPDGRYLAVGTISPSRYNPDLYLVVIIDLKNLSILHELSGHRVGVRPVKFSPDGKLLASGGKDDDVIVWEVESGKMVKKLDGHGHWIKALVFSDDGKRLLSAGIIDRRVISWNTADWTEMSRLELSDRTNDISLISLRDDPDRPNPYLAMVASRNGKIWLWNPDDGEVMQVLSGHFGSVDTVDHAADGTMLSADSSGRLFIWPVLPSVFEDTPDKLYEKARRETGLQVMGVDLMPWNPTEAAPEFGSEEDSGL